MFRNLQLWSLCIGMAVSALGISAASIQAATTVTGWDFDDGTLQGWTLASASSIGPTGFDAVSRTFNGSGVQSWDPIGYLSQNPAAGFAAAPTPFLTERSSAQDAPVVLRSPTFQLYADGEISAHLLGGRPQPGSTPPSNFSDLTGPSINTTATPQANDTAYLGIALRRDSDGAYLLHKGRTSESSGGTAWQQLIFTQAELAPIIAGNPGAQFTLDLIDTAHGSFGNVTMDSVTIPAPPASSLVAGGGQWNVLKRDSATVTSLPTADALLALPDGDAGISAQFQTSAATINMHGSALHGHFPDNGSYPGGSADRFAMKITGQIEVLQAGDITFGFVANDGARLKINGVVVAQDEFFGDIACDNFGTINLTAGFHDVEFVMFETTGADTVELYVATTLGTFTSLNQSSFQLLEAALVPEPAGMMLMAQVLLGAALAGRRQGRGPLFFLARLGIRPSLTRRPNPPCSS